MDIARNVAIVSKLDIVADDNIHIAGKYTSEHDTDKAMILDAFESEVEKIPGT